LKNDKKLKMRVAGIMPTAIVSETATIGANCYIGNFSIVGNNCVVGDNTVIHDNVSLVQNCDIGRNCTIQPRVTIGCDGFSFERDYDTLKLEKFPHLSGVKIGDKVEIHSNCSIARGSLSNTAIGDGTKLDASVHVAHNVVIGRNCELKAGTIIGGSTTIGDMCWTGHNCTIKNKINIGNSVIVDAGACVIHDVPNEDVVAGVPARSIKHNVTHDELLIMTGKQ
jgi:UDP-3-O-[3-hydroxymyristoyl] glucosamine N-acyltransferase